MLSLVNMRLLAMASLLEGGRQQGVEVEDELEVVVKRMVEIAQEGPLAPTHERLKESRRFSFLG